MEKTSKPSFSRTFIVGIDGSEGSHNAFELVVQDLMKPGIDKLFLVHVFNSKKDKDLGLQYQSKTIFHRYSEEVKSYFKEDDYEIIFEDRKENENVFEQINDIAEKNNGSLLVVGFRGYKGTKNRPDELSKSITYLVHKPRIPVLVVKERTARKLRIDGTFKWLLCLESAESKSFKALQSMCRFVDIDNDHVHGLTVDIKSTNENFDDKNEVKLSFEEQMKNYEVRNFDFSVIHREDSKDNIHQLIIKWIRNHLNEETHWIDFIVLGYNPQKYIFDKAVDNTTVDVLKQTGLNVYFDH